MYRIYNNIEDKNIFDGNSTDLISFVKKIVLENEDYNFSILGVSDAIEYIEDFCENLDIKTVD